MRDVISRGIGAVRAALGAAGAIFALALLFPAEGAVAATTTYIYTDQQGTPLVEADATGKVIANFDYRPYGSAYAGGGMANAADGPGYTGHVNDVDTAFVYMQARYYDPAIGRFLSVDPMDPHAGALPSFNRFAYANDNPIVHVDPDGRQVFGSANPEREYLMHGNGEAGVMLLCGCNPSNNAPAGSGSGAVEPVLTLPETVFASGIVRAGGALGGAVSTARNFFGATSLYRAVNPAELSEIVESGGSFRNPIGIQGKYFSSTAEGASFYAKQTYGTSLYEGPYTIVRSSIPTRYITPEMRATVDRGISTITIPTEKLEMLSPGKQLPYSPMPPLR